MDSLRLVNVADTKGKKMGPLFFGAGSLSYLGFLGNFCSCLRHVCYLAVSLFLQTVIMRCHAVIVLLGFVLIITNIISFFF